MLGRVGYGVCVVVAFVAAYAAKRSYEARHGAVAPERRRELAVAALLGAMIGSKLGMLLFVGPREFAAMATSLGAIGDGKTVVGAIAGGFVAVELAKRYFGIHARTGDAYSIALPLGAGIGRFGCAFAGCCYGRETSSALAVEVHGAMRHPAPVYEALLLLAIAWIQSRAQSIPMPLGQRFRISLVAMAFARFSIEALRGDPHVRLGPLTVVQWVCLAAIVGFTTSLLRERRAARAIA